MTHEECSEQATFVELAFAELYSETRISEFEQNAELTEAKLALNPTLCTVNTQRPDPAGGGRPYAEARPYA